MKYYKQKKERRKRRKKIERNKKNEIDVYIKLCENGKKEVEGKMCEKMIKNEFGWIGLVLNNLKTGCLK
jgi:hypothetical protein